MTMCTKVGEESGQMILHDHSTNDVTDANKVSLFIYLFILQVDIALHPNQIILGGICNNL